MLIVIRPSPEVVEEGRILKKIEYRQNQIVSIFFDRTNLRYNQAPSSPVGVSALSAARSLWILPDPGVNTE